MKKRDTRKATVALTMLWTVLLAAATGAQAAPLNLTQTYPDFYLPSVTYSYDSTTGILTVGRVETNSAPGGDNNWMCNPGETCTGTGDVGSYSAGASPSPQLTVTNSVAHPTYVKNFSLYALLNGSGSVLGGQFRVDGAIRSNGWPNQNGCTITTCVAVDGYNYSGGLFSGNLAQFGYSLGTTSTGALEFIFNGASGYVGSEGLGYTGGGMILHVNSSTLTNFGAQVLTTSWTGSGTADVFAPIPAAAWLFGSGLLALLGAARRKLK